VSTIKENLIRRGFVPGYTLWIHHGETVVVDDSDDDQADDAETQGYLSRFTNDLMQQMDRDYGNQQGGSFGSQQGGNEQGGDEAGGAGNDGEAREGDTNDGDNLDEEKWLVGKCLLTMITKSVSVFVRLHSCMCV
jgi:hypothetical protein